MQTMCNNGNWQTRAGAGLRAAVRLSLLRIVLIGSVATALSPPARAGEPIERLPPSEAEQRAAAVAAARVAAAYNSTSLHSTDSMTRDLGDPLPGSLLRGSPPIGGSGGPGYRIFDDGEFAPAAPAYIDPAHEHFGAVPHAPAFSGGVPMETLPLGDGFSSGGFPSDDYFDHFDELRQQVPQRLSPHKSGFFQKLTFSGAWLDGGRVENMGLVELKLLGTVAVPLPTRDHPLLISPGYETRFLHGPLTPDVPPQLHSAFVQFWWVPKITSRWTALIGVEPGIYSDFQSSHDESLRILGRGILRYDVDGERLQLVMGLLYLDRPDVNYLPVVGFIWAPSDDRRYEVVFPRPKLAHRLTWNGRAENWVFLAGEFGGDMWSVQRVGDFEDRLILRDWRLVLGLERRRDGGAGASVEVGYVFNRVIEYRSMPETFDLSDTIMLRASVTY